MQAKHRARGAGMPRWLKIMQTKRHYCIHGNKFVNAKFSPNGAINPRSWPDQCEIWLQNVQNIQQSCSIIFASLKTLQSP